MDWTESKLTTDGYVGRPCWYIGRPEPSVCVLLIYILAKIWDFDGYFYGLREL